MSIDDALLMNERRNARVRRLEKALVGNSARHVADAARRAMPIALGVLAATTLSNVLDALVEAFIAPAVQLGLRSVGVREETLESVTFEICGTPFAFGRFFAAVLDAFATLSAIGVVARVFSGGKLPRFTKCVACLSYMDIDAKVCPCCARDQRRCGSGGDGGDGRALRRAKDLRCWRERFDADTNDDTDDTNDDTDDDTDDDTRAGRPQRRVWEQRRVWKGLGR